MSWVEEAVFVWNFKCVHVKYWSSSQSSLSALRAIHPSFVRALCACAARRRGVWLCALCHSLTVTDDCLYSLRVHRFHSLDEVHSTGAMCAVPRLRVIFNLVCPGIVRATFQSLDGAQTTDGAVRRATSAARERVASAPAFARANASGGTGADGSAT